MRTPIPRLREKNACPMAFINVAVDTFEKSGFKKKDTPSTAPGSDRLTQRSITNMMKSTGIAMFESRSIPFCTPAIRIAMLSPIIINVEINGE